jgi:hypothetical protein
MKRKRSIIQRRKQDRVTGFVLFILVNIILLGIVSSTSPSRLPLGEGLPWVVNGLLVLAMFIFRPEMSVGYLGSILWLILASVGFSVLFVASCVVSVAATLVLQFVPVVGPLVGVILFFGIMLWGLYKGVPAFWKRLRAWWSPEETDWTHQVDDSSPAKYISDALMFEQLEQYESSDFEIGDDGEIHSRRTRNNDS